MRTAKDCSCNPLSYSSISQVQSCYSERLDREYELTLNHHLMIKRSKMLAEMCTYLVGYKIPLIEDVCLVSDFISGIPSKQLMFVDPMEVQLLLSYMGQKGHYSRDRMIYEMMFDFEMKDGRF